jgi:D-alanine-D-alanine ligase-like ATP-grasp enzyme
MTELSLLPKAAKVAGIDFPELCERMLDSAFI